MKTSSTCSTTTLRNLIVGLVAALVCTVCSAQAKGLSEASTASLDSSIAIPVGLVVGGAQLFRDAGQLSVAGVKTVGNVSVIALRAVVSGAEASVQISSKALEGSAIVAGAVVTTTVSATGMLLVFAGSALIFVPNEIGASLLHHSRARDL